MTYQIINILTYLLTFALSFNALSSIRFDKLCYVNNPNKVRLLLILLSMALAYLVTQFIFGLTIYN